MKILSVVSTRPEIIKMAPIIRKAIKLNNVEHVFVTTGQHYDFLLFEKILNDLNLPMPDYNLSVGSGSPGIQIGVGMLLIEKVLDKESPDIVLAQGDTNSVLATALAAVKNGYLFGHVEAGLRSYDMTMPEEINRRLTDHISNILFAPTNVSKDNLLKENIESFRIYVTGNTVVDAVKEHLPIAMKKSSVLEQLDVEPNNYILLTLHRNENTNKDALSKITRILKKICSELNENVVFPIHPRTENLLKVHGLFEKIRKIENLHIIPPLGYLDFLVLMKNAKLVMTDSGGLQEEATVLKVPVIVLRYNTERPEALGKGCVLAGLEEDLILKHVADPPEIAKECPFGDGRASDRIIDVLLNEDLEKHRFKKFDMIKNFKK